MLALPLDFSFEPPLETTARQERRFHRRVSRALRFKRCTHFSKLCKKTGLGAAAVLPPLMRETEHNHPRKSLRRFGVTTARRDCSQCSAGSRDCFRRRVCKRHVLVPEHRACQLRDPLAGGSQVACRPLASHTGPQLLKMGNSVARSYRRRRTRAHAVKSNKD